jgi:hypothetical protein
MLSFKGRHFPKAIILMAVRWYVSYAFSYRDIEELMSEREVKLDHATVQPWVYLVWNTQGGRILAGTDRASPQAPYYKERAARSGGSHSI